MKYTIIIWLLVGFFALGIDSRHRLQGNKTGYLEAITTVLYWPILLGSEIYKHSNSLENIHE